MKKKTKPKSLKKGKMGKKIGSAVMKAMASMGKKKKKKKGY